ncbi:DUF4838 domain-containing protein [bacterium]|nr:DUF4838 domain-containing protein [bacterium]
MTRFARCAWLMLGLLVLTSACASVKPAAARRDIGSVPIVVNLGSFATAREAIDARAKIDWTIQDSPDSIICTEALAAQELHDYLCKMTGTHPNLAEAFPIVDDDAPVNGPAIYVGTPKTNKQVAARAGELGLVVPPTRQGYSILANPNANPPYVIIAGGDRVGTLYGAYEYLERHGVRWFAPGEVNEEVPQIGTFKITALDVTDAPKFLTRGWWCWEDRGTTDSVVWMGRNRINLWSVEQHDAENYKMRGIRLNCGTHFNQWMFINYSSPYPYCVPEWPETKGKPADPYKHGDYPAGVKHKGIPTYGDVHPEWYTFRGGKRVFKMNYDQGYNICDSNMDAMNELMKNTINYLADSKWSMADSINWWVFDGADPWCRCENCLALGSHTDRNLRFIYLFSKELQKARAEGKIKHNVDIEFLCYNDMVEPPTKPIPEDFDYEHCLPTFFPSERCYVHAFNDPRCTEFNRKKFYYNMVTWSKIWKGKFVIGEYYNISRFKGMPMVLDHSMRVDIPFYYSVNARYMHYMHPTTANWGTKALTNYHFAKQLWNPDLDVDKMLDDYFDGRYGPASKPMREFYNTLRDAMSNQNIVRFNLRNRLTDNKGVENLFQEKHMQYKPTHYDKSTTSGLVYDEGPSWTEMLDLMKQCRRQLDAVKAMQLPDRIRARVNEDEGVFIYADYSYKLYDAVIRTQLAINDKKMDDARKAYREAMVYVNYLESDTESTKYGSAHSGAPNAYEATGLDKAIQRMKKQLDM